MALPVNGSTRLIPALLLIYRPRKDEGLSWPRWLTCSGWFTDISGHPSAAGRAQDRESSPVRDRRSTTVPRHRLEAVRLQKFNNNTMLHRTDSKPFAVAVRLQPMHLSAAWWPPSVGAYTNCTERASERGSRPSSDASSDKSFAGTFLSSSTGRSLACSMLTHSLPGGSARPAESSLRFSGIRPITDPSRRTNSHQSILRRRVNEKQLATRTRCGGGTRVTAGRRCGGLINASVLYGYVGPGRQFIGSRVVSVLDSGAVGPGFKSQPRRCRVTVLGKLFTPIAPLFAKQRNR